MRLRVGGDVEGIGPVEALYGQRRGEFDGVLMGSRMSEMARGLEVKGFTSLFALRCSRGRAWQGELPGAGDTCKADGMALANTAPRELQLHCSLRGVEGRKWTRGGEKGVSRFQHA